MEAQFSVAPQDHGQLTSIGRDRRRFEQGFVRSLQDLDSLAVLETPQAVTSALRGQVEQRPPGKPWRERPHRRQQPSVSRLRPPQGDPESARSTGSHLDWPPTPRDDDGRRCRQSTGTAPFRKRHGASLGCSYRAPTTMVPSRHDPARCKGRCDRRSVSGNPHTRRDR